MDIVFFTSIQLNPISCKSGKITALNVNLDELNDVNDADLVVTSSQPAVVQLIDQNNNVSPVIRINLGKLVSPKTSHTCQLRFKLIQSTTPAGSIVGIKLYVEDTATGQQISPTDGSVLVTVTP